MLYLKSDSTKYPLPQPDKERQRKTWRKEKGKDDTMTLKSGWVTRLQNLFQESLGVWIFLRKIQCTNQSWKIFFLNLDTCQCFNNKFLWKIFLCMCWDAWKSAAIFSDIWPTQCRVSHNLTFKARTVLAFEIFIEQKNIPCIYACTHAYFSTENPIWKFNRQRHPALRLLQPQSKYQHILMTFLSAVCDSVAGYM